MPPVLADMTNMMPNFKSKNLRGPGARRSLIELASRDSLKRLPAKLLFLYERRPKSTYIFITLVSAGIAKVLFAAIAGNLGSPLISNTGENVAAALVALPVVPLLRYFAMHEDIQLVMSIGAEAGAPHKGPILSFLSENLEEMKEQLKSLQGPGAVLDPYKVAQWVRYCFEGTDSTRYVGTDSHKPSEYDDIYADYLAAHASYIKRIEAEHGTQPQGRRYLVNSVGHLRTDRRTHVKPNAAFANWHDKNHVDLWQIDKFDNSQLLADNDLTGLLDTDIGFWDNQYVLLFNPVAPKEGEPEEGKRIKLRVAFKGDALYADCARYVELLEHTDSVKTWDKDLPFYPKELSDNWKRFALPDERLKQTGPFVEAVAGRLEKPKDQIRILDAATGVGFETVYLLKEGYIVTSNEIESSLREAATRYSSEQGRPIPVSQFSSANWLELDTEFQANQFDIVLVIGNSLCHLDTVEQVSEALAHFYKVLRPGGYLVCDERNFAKIQREWNEIQPDPLNNFSYNNDPERVMYRGTDVLGAPFHKEGKRIIFEYWDVKRVSGKFQPQKKLGALSMFSFEQGFLCSRLSSAGFSAVETFCNLKPCDDDPESLSAADFLTYVARK
jgi:glycine/sarcosine N-methyltransferase